MEYEVKRYDNPLVIGEVVSKRVTLEYTSGDIADYVAGRLLKIATATTGTMTFWGGSEDTDEPCAVLAQNLSSADFDETATEMVVTVYYGCRVDYDRVIEANPDAVPAGSEALWGGICAKAMTQGLNIYKLNA